jgi:murein DD-endopeptidase
MATMPLFRSAVCLLVLACAACPSSRTTVAPAGSGAADAHPASLTVESDAGLGMIADAMAVPGGPDALAAAPAIHDGVTGSTLACEGWQLVDTTVRGSISESLSAALVQDGVKLAAHLSRIFMWDLNLRRDVEPGDRVRILWRRNDAGDPEIRSARYQSSRLGRALWVYRFAPDQTESPSYWDRDGVEVPRRLKGSPLFTYDQITALLKDRPTHQGMDFKTPEGTEVHVPRAGVATRLDWKLRGNGHCVEIRYDDGTLAKFLHLSAIKVRGGARVRPGQVIALTGNTGHSTAPHLHYQLNRGTRTVDPVDYHGVLRRQLERIPLAKFRAELADFDSKCAAAVP